MGSKRIGARWLGTLIVAAAALTACSDPGTAPPLASKVSSQPTLALNDVVNNTPVAGQVKICKLGNASGTFAVSGVANTGGTGTVQNPITVSIADVCRIAALSSSPSGTGFDVTVTENAAANTVQALTSCVGLSGAISCVGPFFINFIHGVVLTYTNTFTQPTGTLNVCKVAGTGVTVGTNYSFTAAGTAFQVAAGAGPTGTCSNRGSFNTGTVVTVQETVPLGGSVSIVGGTPNNAAGNTVITIATGTNTVTFTNTLPPPPVCDFITFGRLVTEIGGQKVVVSGNAGGNQPGGGILAEFHIEVNGVDNHVADVDFYGPIASGALSGAAFPLSRRTGGTAKNGNTVELRLWDGGEPGKDTDYIWFRINGATYGPATIDQGNMQYHSNCRGPGN